MTGSLDGIRVIEFGAIGPGPFAGMMLADHGADVIRIDRTNLERDFSESHHVLDRGRRSIALNLKDAAASAVVRELLIGADVLIEGFRPGVMERLGFGPEAVLTLNPRLVYGRMTGWGQDGPLAGSAGHDISYVAVTGALEPIAGGEKGDPVVPLNMLGDFGGGGMLLAFGILAGLLHARSTGQGQVVDAAIVDGTALFTGMLQSMRSHGAWTGARGNNMLDGGAPYYRTYRTSDDKWMAVGAIEPRFYKTFLQCLELTDQLPLDLQNDITRWPSTQALIARKFEQRTSEHWQSLFSGTDACVAPVLSPAEAPQHEHLHARGTFAIHDDTIHPAPAPRFGATPGSWPGTAPQLGRHSRDILTELGHSPAEIDHLMASGAAAEAQPQATTATSQ